MDNTTTVTIRDLGPSANPANQVINRPPPQKQGNPPPIGGVGKSLLNINGVLSKVDPRDKKIQQPSKTYNVPFTAGRRYFIRLNSNQFDAVLRLEDANGQEVAIDDDGGGNLNALIVYTPQQNGVFRVIATTLNGRTGLFQLTVQEQ